MDIIKKINQDVEEIKVISGKEETLTSFSEFVSLKKGVYDLNNGKSIYRESIVKKIGSGDAVCILAVTTEKKILIVLNPRVVLPTNNNISIEIPAGYIEADEDVYQAGLRELLEETGYTTDDIVEIDSYYPSLGFSSERTTLLLALNCFKVSEQKLDNDEVLCCEEVTLEEFEYLLNASYIMDANARIGYYRYLEYLMKEGC